MNVRILGLAVVSFVISLVATFAMRRIAPRIGFVDKPGHRKIHHQPKPLGGGVAILLGIGVPMLAGFAWLAHRSDIVNTYHLDVAHGARSAIGMLVAMTAMHVLGLWDDRKALGPYLKLAAQLLITAALVIALDL